jgi:hypothetical protein
MNRQATNSLNILVWSTLALTAVAAKGQEAPPARLVRAAQCLQAKHFLPPSNGPQSFGYLIDTESYPGNRVIYVVGRPKPAAVDGYVFALFIDHDHGRQRFNIQNNARFRSTPNGSRIEFVDEALGGVWTHQHLISAIRRIQHGKHYLLPRELLIGTESSGGCESYSDRH